MALSQIRDLQIAWLGNNKHPTEFSIRLDAAFDAIGFTEQYVEKQIASSKFSESHRTKVIKDNVWGMIELDEPAIRLIDCPIVQRLRRKRQLGFSYLTYPSAEHSRFVHCLGMLGVVARFLDTATRDASPPPAGTSFHRHDLQPSERADLLHAALMHDTGHLPFSHATEFAFESLGRTRVGGLSLIEFFQEPEERQLVRRPKLAELISVSIVLSRRFGRYYCEYVRAGEENEALDDSPLRIASYILGRPVDKNNIGYAELISGRVIDADKLDYVSRDGLACGIPVGIDVGRLFLRSGFLRVNQDELNTLRKRRGYELVDTDQVHFIVNAAGRDTIEELITARTSLFHRVYFHQTTRNAERLYERVIECALEDDSRASELDVLRVWAASDEQFLSDLSSASNCRVSALATRLSGRQLPKRAAIFGQGELRSLFPVKSVFPTSRFSYDEAPLKLPHLQRFSKLRLCGEALTQLEGEISDECMALAELIRDNLPAGSPIAAARERPLVLVSPAQFSPPVHDDCLVLQNRELVFSKELHNVTQTSDAEEIFQAAGYVLTDEPWREIAFIATRKLLAQKTREWLRVEVRVDERLHAARGSTSAASALDTTGANLQARSSRDVPELFTATAFSALMLDQEKVVGRTSINRRRLQQVEDYASGAGYFDDLPVLTSRPSLDWPAISGKFSKFEGQYGWKITKELVEAFIWQFPPKFRSSATSLLLRVEVLDRLTAAELIHTALNSLLGLAKGRKIKVAPLSPNSGHEVRIALEERFRSNDEFRRHFELHHSLEELLVHENRGDNFIALIDDNVVSGSQAFAQLASWMNIARDLWPANISAESNIDRAPLSVGSQAKFLDRLSRGAVGLCVAYGSATKAAANLSAFAKLLEAQSSSLVPESVTLFEDSSPFEIQVFTGRSLAPPTIDALKPSAFMSFLADVGAHLVASSQHKTPLDKLDDEKKKFCADNALGYDNARGLTFTFRNAPVSTMTPLWCPGIYHDRPWMPLGIRRGYSHQVILG